MRSRRLIVNADDFGLSDEVNEAVILAYRRGILTSCSLMSSGKAFDSAVRLARENPGLAVGIHVTSVDGKCVLRPREISHLVDGHGNFLGSPATLSLKYFFCKRARKELLKEVEAQFEKFLGSGIECSHIDSHCHMHVNPAVFSVVAELGKRYGVKTMRVPDDDFFAAASFVQKPAATAGYALVFKLLAGSMKRRLRSRGFKFASRVYGNLLTGSMSKEYVLSVLDALPAGMSEIYFHPALPAGSAQGDRRRMQQARELSLLLDPEIGAKMKAAGIVPATYIDLDKMKNRIKLAD